jgi:Tfp pilus assembly protein PilF
MHRLMRAGIIGLLGLCLSGPRAQAQVHEDPPVLAHDGSWEYASPGPAKCTDVGNYYLHKGDMKAALSRFEEALRDNPHYAPAYLGMGKVYERMKENKKALNAYQRYLDELPSAKDAKEARDVQRAVARLKNWTTAD